MSSVNNNFKKATDLKIITCTTGSKVVTLQMHSNLSSLHGDVTAPPGALWEKTEASVLLQHEKGCGQGAVAE